MILILRDETLKIEWLLLTCNLRLFILSKWIHCVRVIHLEWIYRCSLGERVIYHLYNLFILSLSKYIIPFICKHILHMIYLYLILLCIHDILTLTIGIILIILQGQLFFSNIITSYLLGSRHLFNKFIDVCIIIWDGNITLKCLTHIIK